MRTAALLAIVFTPVVVNAANCSTDPPQFGPVTTTFEQTCAAGQTIISLNKAKSPVAKLNFGRRQEITISTVSGAKSSGGNGSGAQVCIWRSWDKSQPCGKSLVSQDGFNDWDGSATCSLVVPAGVQYVQALQTNSNADEQNTTLEIVCR
ncbi:hypothetical protein [Variovorax soli]|uniref:Secreted protein n=1 Tax=Variovorax soli TaxID=376815 RepID=A0ABU1NK68_9BURK|nr:hypothetical protein [Variovorax soli]MDR6538854.1 hypothetical protein [Variovorax soli]